MAAQYFYNIGGSTLYVQGRGVQVASGLTGTPDFTIEAWVKLTSNTVAQTFFEIGNSTSSGGTIAMGVDTSGKLTLTIDRANPGNTFVHTPGSVSLPTGTWFHVGCVLQTKWDANTYQVCSLYNGVCTLGLSYLKSVFSSGMGSICQMGGNFGSTSYLTGSITNFRVSSSPTVYQNPWGTRLSYTKVYPLEKLGSTTVLLQGSPIVNTASPLSTVTALSLFPITIMPELLYNIPPTLSGAYNTSAGYLGPIAATPSLQSAFTFEVWVHVTTGGGTQVIFDSVPVGQRNGAIAHRFAVGWNSSLQLLAYFGTPGVLATSTNSTIPLNVWTHIAYVWNGSNTTLTPFVNGVACTEINVNATVQCQMITIGCEAPSPGNTIQGSVHQPLLRTRVVYTSNFTPAIDLTPAWNDTSVAYFLGAGLVEQVTGSVVPIGGTVVSTYRTLV